MFLMLFFFTQWGIDNYEAKYFCPRPYYEHACAESTHLFNVLKYELDCVVPMTSRTLQGVNKIKCKSMVNGLNVATLHSRTLTIDSVRVDGTIVSYSTANETLHINLPNVYNSGDSFMIYIRYRGSWSVTGSQTGFVFYPRNYNVNTRHAIAYSLGEPWDARQWMPCYDEPFDKAEQGCIIKVTTPDSFQVCANGELVGVTSNPGGTKTYTYQENYPITTYLMHFGVSRFAKWSHWYHPATGDSVEIRYFIWPEDSAQSVTAFQYVPVAMYLFDSLYGNYPFHRYGQDAVYPFAWGGMEHQEQTTIHRNWILSQSENGMAHELSHQWGGDMVTCVDFRNIWLNEGFGTYSDANYNWYRLGYSNFITTMQNRANDYFSADASSRHPIYNPPLNLLFDWGHSYCKGSWVFHMLRYLNPNQYFNGINNYLDSFAYKTASTEDLKRIFNQTYGTDLTWFFNEWVYGQGHPVYDIYWMCNRSGSNYLAKIKIYQVQTNAPPLFHMPVQILLHMPSKDTLVNIPITISPQYTEYTVSDTVTSIVFDPNTWLLKRYNIYVGIEDIIATIPGDNDLYIMSNPIRNLEVLYTVNQTGKVRVTLYDVGGRLVREVCSGIRAPGKYSANISQLPAGVYFCRLETLNSEKIKKLVVLR